MKIMTNSKELIDSLKKIDIESSFDVVSHLPYRYDNYEYSLEDIICDKQKVVLLGKLVSNARFIRAKNLDIVSFYFMSVNNKLYQVKAYNRPYLSKFLNLEDQFTLMANFNEARKEMVLINIKKGEIPPDERLKGIYHLPMEVSNNTFANLVKRTLESTQEEITNLLPSQTRERFHLLSHYEALKNVHFPKNKEELAKGLRTLKFEECLEYCLRNRIIREDNNKIIKSNNIEIDTNKINDFIRHLSFKLTLDQVQAVREIILDMKRVNLMYRLLQGDVGTGKTLVAGIALYANYLRHKQGVFLAPTESLTNQQYEYLVKLFKGYDLKIAKLTGSNTTKEKNQILEELKEGNIDILVGTHAVFSKDTRYHNLGLAIIDEQHRFGVNQRNLLFSKGEEVDLLLMSATPIPRTLSISIYGDLEVSSLNQFPNGKRDVKTLVTSFDSPKITGLIDYCLKNNAQVFLVCPKIIKNPERKTKSAEEIYEKYLPLYGDKIGLLHGKMKKEEKDLLLDNFRNFKTPILVATSIVELGIDVKSAMGMIVFSADSFGLASLHQLRGRVGRNGEKGYCLLVDEETEDNDLERLKFLETCSDGFEISEEDMKRRGPGDFTGIEQSGFPSFNSLNIVSDYKMFAFARDEASLIIHNQDEVEFKRYFELVKNKIEDDAKQITLFD